MKFQSKFKLFSQEPVYFQTIKKITYLYELSKAACSPLTLSPASDSILCKMYIHVLRSDITKTIYYKGSSVKSYA